jgi:DNA-binding CsgD family transcriptional regulator
MCRDSIPDRDRDEKEKLSDEMLKTAQAHQGEYPAYSEHYLAARDRRRATDGPSIEELFERTSSNLNPVDDLFECSWTEIRSGASKAGLSIRQVDIMALRYICVEGKRLTQQQIADLVGCHRDTVRADLKYAAARIHKIPLFGLWTVLSEVFRVSVARIRDFLLNI